MLPRVAGCLVAGTLFGILWAIGSFMYTAIFPDRPRPVFLPPLAEALALGAGTGLAVGVVVTVGTALEAASDKENAASPRDLLRKNRVNVLARLLAAGLAIGVGYSFVQGPAPGVMAGFIIGVSLCPMNAWGRWVVLARIWLSLTGRVSPALLAFLEDAHDRGVLRQAGAVYQFRHARIQAQLAEGFTRGQRQPHH